MARDGIILLHGIGRGRASMARLDGVLRDAGYRTLALDYPSRRFGIADLAAHVDAASHGWIEGLDAPVHLVTHSMGGLVGRALVARRRPARLGRVVMLGPPNQGSELADLLGATGLYRRLFGPAGAELATLPPAALAATLGNVDYPLGIIAGDRALDPLSWALLPKPNDGKVTVARTKLPGMADHLVVAATHTLMMRNPAVIRATLGFLRDGRFPA